MANESKHRNNESDIELETITNMPGIEVPECCRENWDDCEHKLPPQEKKETNPI